MSWTPVIVVAAIAILVPIALVAAFASTKDTHQYSAHYSKHGFTQETEEELLQIACSKQTQAAGSSGNATGTASRSANGRGPECGRSPVSEWPTEL